MKKNLDKILIFDTTLRDGEQAPGASMSLNDKIEIAILLDEMGADIIESGFPISSKGDFRAVHAISKVVKNASVCALTRARKDDILCAADALSLAKNKRIHTFISTSDIHMKYKLRMDKKSVLSAIQNSVKIARKYSDDVEWSCEDGTRSDIDFLCRCFETAIKFGATTVNIADTVGYITPNEFTNLINTLFEKVDGIDTVRFSVHCHNDLGLATSNSLAAILAGARQIECSINGIGERAGNASLEEIVMCLATRKEIFPYYTQVDSSLLTVASQMVSNATGFLVPPNKAIVGSNAFSHESGIHQHGVINNPSTYEIIDPKSVGALGSKLVMGRHSGRHAFKVKLKELGCKLSDNAIEDSFLRFKDYADTTKQVSNNEILEIVKNTF
jgi:2-isopropylmalate synthase